MPEIVVQLVTGGKHVLDVPDGGTVAQLRERTAKQLQLPRERLRLVHKGHTLQDHADVPVVADADVILAFVAPKLPAAHFGQQAHPTEADDEAEDRFRLRPNATWLECRLAYILQQKLRMPDWALQLVFSISLRTIICIILWFLLAPVAARYSVGPLYVLGTILVVILTNLGSRKDGELSAYSIFNPGARQLPGQLNADAIDQQIRAGHI